jgi:hypothetical protein
MLKKTKPVKCSKCNVEFSESELFDEHSEKAYVLGDKIFCKDCLQGNWKQAQTYLEHQNSQGTHKPHEW